MKIKQISFKSGGAKLDGNLYVPEEKGKLPGVVIYHGRGSSKDRYTDRAEVLARSGFLTLIFSFRGCGNSEGNFKDQTIEMGVQDALAGYDFLSSQQSIDRKRIGVFGGSFGGYLAAIETEKRSINSLILAAPAMYKNKHWKKVPETVQKENQNYRKHSEFVESRAIKTIRKYTGNLLIIRHEKDDICPKNQVEDYYKKVENARKKQLHIINNAPHPLHGQKLRDESNQITADWFKKTL